MLTKTREIRKGTILRSLFINCPVKAGKKPSWKLALGSEILPRAIRCFALIP